MKVTRFEIQIRNECKHILNNPKLTDDDIQEWSSSKNQVLKNLVEEKEVFIECPMNGVYCAVLKTADKREEKTK